MDVKTTAMAMKTTQMNSGLITEQAIENIAMLQSIWQNGYANKEHQDEINTIRQVEGIFAWYNQLKEGGKTLPENTNTPGYNPETRTVLEADDEANCPLYRECYLRMYLIPQVAKKLVDQFQQSQKLGDIEAMKPETIAAIDAVMAEAKKLID